MKRKIGLILTVIMALSLVLGICVTAMAETPPEGCPVRMNQCTCAESGKIYYLYENNGTTLKFARYLASGTYEGISNYPITFLDNPIIGTAYHENNFVFTLCACNNSKPESDLPSASVHTHNFVTGVIYDATSNSDGLEGTYCSTCGFIKESRSITAFEYTLTNYADQKLTPAKSGQTIVLEFGEFNSFPKSFMEKIAAKVASGVTIEFRYKVNHKLQKITIPAGSVVDTTLDWYGPATMEQLYGAN